jgi:outer membrane receptor protein involved in Fe transport
MLSFTQHSSGQGKNEEVTIIAPYIPSIGDATKMPFRPEIAPGEQANPTFKYDYVTKSYKTNLELDPIEPLKYSEGKQDQFYRNYAKAGIGNYYTPYLDFMASSLQNEKYQFGTRLNYYSSQGKIKNYPPSAYSHGLISVFGRTFTKTHTLSADMGYERDVVHFYGFSPDSFPDIEYTKDDIKQRFQHIHGAIEFGSNYREKYKLNHLFGLGLHYFSDFYQTRESQVSFITKLDKAFKTGGNDFEHSFALDLGLDYLGYRDSISSSHPLFFLIKPVYRLELGQYRFEAGLNINMAAENSAGESNFGVDVFPILKAEVEIVEEKFKAYAEVSGNRTINSFRSIAGINPFVISNPRVKYTDEQIKIGGGITGNAGGLNFLAEAWYSYLKDMPLFVTDTSLLLQNRFDVIYDNMNLLNIKASIGYVKINQLSARLMAAYYQYIPKNEEKAWQMPNFEIGMDAAYTLQEKYTLRLSVLALGTKYARTIEDGKVVPAKMSGAFDLGAGFEYQINKMISAYVDANNLLNQHYQRWYNYPVQGILVMAGVKLSF